MNFSSKCYNCRHEEYCDYVKDGTSGIGCSLFEFYPEYCWGCEYKGLCSMNIVPDAPMCPFELCPLYTKKLYLLFTVRGTEEPQPYTNVTKSVDEWLRPFIDNLNRSL